MQKKKWTGRRYGHEQVVDQDVILAQTVIQYNTTNLSRYSRFILLIIGSFIIMLVADSFLQTKRQAALYSVKRFLAQQEWPVFTKAYQDSSEALREMSRALKTQVVSNDNLEVLQKEVGFFSGNSFNLPHGSGVIYMNPTNFLGRIAPFMAKRFLVAIILVEGKKLTLSDVVNTLGIEVIDNENFKRSNISYIEMSIPVQQWTWFSRYLNKTIL